MNDITKALDGAKAVVTRDMPSTTVVAVWNGGTTVNVWTVIDGKWSNTDAFNLSDGNGEPVKREEMVEHMNEWLDSEL